MVEPNDTTTPGSGRTSEVVPLPAAAVVASIYAGFHSPTFSWAAVPSWWFVMCLA